MKSQAGLTIIRLPSTLERKQWLDGFMASPPGDVTWVVADVRSKLAIQKRLLLAQGFAEAKSVMRASELWRAALRELKPELQVVSSELILASLTHWLRDESEPWLQAPGAAKTARAYIGQLLPLLTDPMLRLDDWFSEEGNSAAAGRWSKWAGVAKKLWLRLEAAKLCDAAWLPAALCNVREHLHEVIPQNLIVDLGADLSAVESDLLLELAKHRRVSVFRPTPAWESEYPNVHLAADWMLREAPARGVAVTTTENTRLAAEQPIKATYKRLPSAAAEVKQAVAQARRWLEAGVPPSRIAIVAPDLEAYWPMLALHLDVEGIVVNKAVVSALHSFTDIARWLARLRVRTGLPDSRDLEMDLFGEATPPLTFAAFQEVFSRLYDASELELSNGLMAHYQARYQDRGRWDDQVLTRDAFLARAVLTLAEGDDSSRVIRLFKTVLEECPPDVEFQPTMWVRYLSEVAARIEINVAGASTHGIQALNLVSLEGVDVSHVVAMGLHDGALRGTHGTAIDTADWLSLERFTGFVIDGEDRRRTEFEARWTLAQPREEQVFLFADADAGGMVQTPSWTWIAGAWQAQGETPELDVPDPTRLDERQARAEDSVGSAEQRLRLRRERGLEPPKAFAGGAIDRLSATTIDAVAKCSLRFAFDRILGPRDEGRLDLDVDRSRQGQLQHKIFELLGQEGWREYGDDELLQLIDRARDQYEAASKKKIVRDPEAWQSLRRRLAKTARGLLTLEQDLKRKAPQLHTAGCEIEFSGEIEGVARPISGQIDRVDITDDGRAVIVDYKSSALEQSFSSWRKQEMWQPLLYALAVERGWLKWEGKNLARKLSVAGVFLYDAKRARRGRGLRVRETGEGLFEFPARTKAQSREDLDGALIELEATIQAVNKRLDSGEFVPTVFDEKECVRCRWQGACRAAHLELL